MFNSDLYLQSNSPKNAKFLRQPETGLSCDWNTVILLAASLKSDDLGPSFFVVQDLDYITVDFIPVILINLSMQLNLK